MTKSTGIAEIFSEMNLREIATSGLGFWERGRLIYNVLLAAIVVGYYLAKLPGSRAHLDLDSVLSLFVLAVGANVVYSLAYVADVFVQLSGFRAAWLRWRWILFAVGTACAATITRFMVLGFLSSSPR
jgi:hypothetical protein